MSDDFDFNPKPKEDDKGVGKIRLGEDGKPAAEKTEERAKASAKKKWLIGGGIGVGVLALTLTLSGVFNSASNNQTAPVTPPPIVQVQPPVQTQQPVQAELSAAQLLQQSVAAKQGVIYRDPARAYYQTTRTGARTGELGEAYLNLNGQEVRAGQDFAAHVQLLSKGAVSLLVASGPYAGSRIEFTPVGTRGGSSITYTRVGQEAIGADGRTTVFQVLPTAQQTTQTVSMKSPATAGNGVTVPGSAWEYEKQVQEKGEFVSIFRVQGNVEEGVFSIRIFNDDVYQVNFATGQYSLNSVYLFHPNWETHFERTGQELDVRGNPTINGVLNVAPAVRPQPVTAQRAPRPGG